MQFPHLSDTQFPNLSTVNVYQFQNNFDYTRWTEKTKITLCNVIWNSDYTDVVKWDTNEERDNWFDSLNDVWVEELRTAARVVPEGYVKLPIPYDVMARYNYLFVDMPIATSSDNPIDYENESGIRRWYFFVNNIQYLAPNATQAYVVPDIWTNFQNDIDITYMLLERGHAPVAASDTEEYLENPIANNRYLLAPDVNYDNAGITRSCNYVPFGNGEKYVCFASTCAPHQLAQLGAVSYDSDYDPDVNTITYQDQPNRYGYQLDVYGFSVGNGYDYSQARTPASVGYANVLNAKIANNLTVYAIPAAECYFGGAYAGTFYTDILAQCPQFLTTIKACFVVDLACLTLSYQHTLAGHTIFECSGKESTLLEKSLTIQDFDYPEELQRFAKLYTAPYAQLEITDNDGTTYTINIEETSTLSVKSVVSVAFPYINERVYIDGIGGTGSQSYTWVDLAGRPDLLDMPNSDWFKYCFDWEIPTFALYMDGETAFMLETFNRNVAQATNQALVSYHCTMRSVNTEYPNAIDQSNTAYTNTTENARVARENAYRSADTGKFNADDTADAARTMSYNNADLSYRTIDRVCTAQSQNLATANAAIAANEETGISSSSIVTGYHNDKNDNAVYYGNRMVQFTTQSEVNRSTATTQNSMVGTIATSALSGAQAGVVMGGVGGASIGSVAIPGIGTVPGAAVGALGGAVVGGVGGGISAAVNYLNMGETTNIAQSVADAQIDNNSNLNSAGNSFAIDITNVQNDTRRIVYRKNADSSTAQMDNSNAKSRENATDSRNVAKANADTSRNTAKGVATRTRNTSKANADATYNVTVDSAGRTKTVLQNNALYTRNTGVRNAKEILENSRNSAMAAIKDSRNSAPIEVCAYSGDPQADYMRTRGIQIKVKTQSDSAIRQTGDTFARFGYTLNQVWDVATSGLKLMRHFTYWKAAEIWVDDRQSSNNAVNTFIHNMFLNGVTVWNDPTEIGRINVYDN